LYLLIPAASSISARRSSGRAETMAPICPLLHDRVAARSDARVAEEVEHVAQPAGHLVDQVLRLPRAVEAASDLDLGEGGVGRRCIAVGVVEGEHDLRHAHRRPRVGAGEDHVLHALAPQATRRLLAHGPAHGVDHVRLAAAVGADDAGDPGLEAEHGLVDEGLEARDLE
jgi:hypothetical protein